MSGTAAEVVAKRTVEQFVKSIPGLKANHEALKRFYLLCKLADELGEEFDAEDVQIGTDPTRGFVSIDVFDIEFSNGRSHYFFEHIKAADFLSFSKSKNNMLRIQFGVNGLWVRA